jgi:hypothetical protein
VRRNFWRLRDKRGIHVHDRSLAKRDLPRGLFQKYFARRAFPARIGVRKKMATSAWTS